MISTHIDPALNRDGDLQFARDLLDASCSDKTRSILTRQALCEFLVCAKTDDHRENVKKISQDWFTQSLSSPKRSDYQAFCYDLIFGYALAWATDQAHILDSWQKKFKKNAPEKEFYPNTQLIDYLAQGWRAQALDDRDTFTHLLERVKEDSTLSDQLDFNLEEQSIYAIGDALQKIVLLYLFESLSALHNNHSKKAIPYLHLSSRLAQRLADNDLHLLIFEINACVRFKGIK